MPIASTLDLITYLNNILIYLDEKNYLSSYEIKNINNKIKNAFYFSKEIDKILEELNMYNNVNMNLEIKNIYFNKLEHIINILSQKL